jgi:uroporphyrinogen-III synthase
VRIVLTRPEGRNEQLAERLRARGHVVTVVPLIAVDPLGDEPIDVTGYDWVVVTSVTGARELKRRLRGRPRRVAAIGQATAAAFGSADLVPRVATQEGLLDEFPPAPGRVLFAGAEGARRLLVDSLHADFLPLYRTRQVRPAEPVEGDLVVLASASAARALGELRLDLPAVSIGPETTAAAREVGVHVVGEAKTHDLDGLVEAVAAATR